MPETSAFSIPHSPIAALGTITLLIAFVVGAYTATTGILGNQRQSRRMVTSSIYGLYGFFALMMFASALIIYAFVTHDYSIKYVYQYSDTTMPLSYKITAYWGGLDGSLMFWVAVLAIFSAIAVKANSERHRDMIGYVVGTIMLVQLFFLALLIYNKNPFATFLTEVPTDGKGLNPLLQNYWMVIHPPSLYTGFVAATIPFAFGIAAMASGRLDDRWLSSVRSWTLISWFFLSFGLILGGRWAYEELGWGGYWAWDPVENAGFLPWFTMTAFLHSVIIQEQRGFMKSWNLVLIIITFFLTIFGTFMTRSGIVQSVHAFGEDNALALLFVLFMAGIVIVSLGLLLHRLPALRSKSTFESMLSREFAFLLNNWILLGCAFFVLFGTMWPTIAEAVTGNRVTVGPPFFNKMMIPVGLVLLFLAGAAPLLAWRRTTSERLWNQFVVPTALAAVTIAGLAIFVPQSRALTSILADWLKLPIALINFGLVAFTVGCIGQEFVKGIKVRKKQTKSDGFTSLIGLIFTKRRKYGGYVVHLGIAVMFVGFAGKTWESMEDFTVSPGQTFSLHQYTFVYADLVTEDDDHKRAVTAQLAVYEGPVKAVRKDGVTSVTGPGDFLADLTPARWQYKKLPDQPTTEVSIKVRFAEDVYAILTGFDADTKQANFRIYLNPLILWVWVGFGILILGTFICLFPKGWVDSLGAPKRTRAGQVAEAASVILVLAAFTFGISSVARAQAPAEHDTGVNRHQVGVSAAHLYRPNDATFLAPYRARVEADLKAKRPELSPGSPEFDAAVAAELQPAVALVSRIMRDLVCMCGGCTRESALECKCGYAAEERKKVFQYIAAYDLLDKAQREKAYDDITGHFISEYGGQQVLMVPKASGFNLLSWVIPFLAVAGGLVLILAVGRRYVNRQPAVAGGPIESAGSPPSGTDEQDEDYEDLLDDELRDYD